MPASTSQLHTERQQRINRLILVTTSAWLLAARDAQLLGVRYQPKDDAGDTEIQVAAVARLITRLLDGSGGGSASVRRILNDDGPPCSGPELLTAPLPDDELTPLVRNDLRRVMPPANPTAAAPPPPVTYRIFLDATRFLAVTGITVPDVPFWVLIDLRFSRLLNQLRCHAAVSVWSTAPQHPDLVPTAPPAGNGRLTLDVPSCARAFRMVADAAEGLLKDHLHAVHMHVFEREYTLPVFWVVAPKVPPSDPTDYLEDHAGTRDGWLEWTSERTKELLGTADARDHRLTRAVLNANFLILRRVPRTEGRGGTGTDRNVPTYLILPGGPDLQPDLAPGTALTRELGEDLEKRRADVEYAAASLINELANIEAQAANLLHLHQRDLEVWSNHLKVYNSVVERGAFLWDALSTHLMIRWGAPFERAHTAVDMLHQVLQQAVADLRLIATLTHQATARIGEAADQLQDSYDQRIGEHVKHGEAGLRAALTETGLFGRVTRTGSEILAVAERVKSSYDDLLKAISGAFDERRVRELDGTQKASFFIGFFGAFIGLVTVLDAVFTMKPGDGTAKVSVFGGPAWLGTAAAVASLLIGGAAFVLSLVLGFQVRGIGKLGTHVFRDLYHGNVRWHPRRLWRRIRSGWKRQPRHGLWRFLKDTSTDFQKLLRRKYFKEPRGAWNKAWTDHDIYCASELAAIWDDALRLPGCRRHDRFRKDIKGLSRLIEQWGVHSLLLTERARVMHWFDLPNLTCLYRCCTLIRGSFLALSDLGDTLGLPINMVADNDITLALMRQGFTRDDAKRIDGWLLSHEIDGTFATRPGFKNAQEAWDRVQQLKLRVGMTAADREVTLAVLQSP